MKKIKVGSDFSGVGAFDQALLRLGVHYETIFACDMDKYARQTFIHNYGEPKYYPLNVYDREIPKESLDIYMTSPPCQAFSLAGKRLGKEDKRGILFFNSHEFIQVNKPRFFIFENVKGLLSDDGGRTFKEWVNMLGGKSVNGLPVLFPYEDSVPYHLYWQVLNAKQHGVPQNRERVFLVGIRDDQDNKFQFPREEHLTKRLKDVLEDAVDDKYFLSEKMLELITFQEKTNGEIANLNKGGERVSVYDSNTDSMSCLSATDYKQPKQILINSATSKGYEEAREGDSINFSVPSSETRRGRVGKGVAQTLDTGCNQGVMVCSFGRSEEEKKRRREHFQKTGKDSGTFKDKELILKNQEYYDTLLANPNPQKEDLISENYKIRRLTPRECFRLMDFPDTFTWPVSDSQAYKQAGNSIVVNVLCKILKNLSI
jgi:DNA (cytosine-5)-methyltransferase 1